MKVSLKPVQALMTVSLILSLVTFALYSVWLWKGEGCATPWRKRCVWCRETYVRYVCVCACWYVCVCVCVCFRSYSSVSRRLLLLMLLSFRLITVGDDSPNQSSPHPPLPVRLLKPKVQFPIVIINAEKRLQLEQVKYRKCLNILAKL